MLSFYISPIRSNSSPPVQYSKKRYIIGPSFRWPKKRTILGWLSIYQKEANKFNMHKWNTVLQNYLKSYEWWWWCTARQLQIILSVLKVTTNLINADLLLDIFSALYSLWGIDHFHCYRLLCQPVHQQPHSDNMNRQIRAKKKK